MRHRTEGWSLCSVVFPQFHQDWLLYFILFRLEGMIQDTQNSHIYWLALTSMFALSAAVLLQHIYQFPWQLSSRALSDSFKSCAPWCMYTNNDNLAFSYFCHATKCQRNNGVSVWVCVSLCTCVHEDNALTGGWGARMTHSCVAQTNSLCPWSSIWAACLEKCLDDIMRKSGHDSSSSSVFTVSGGCPLNLLCRNCHTHFWVFVVSQKMKWANPKNTRRRTRRIIFRKSVFICILTKMTGWTLFISFSSLATN